MSIQVEVTCRSVHTCHGLTYVEYTAQIYLAYSVTTDGISMPSEGRNTEPCHSGLFCLVKYNGVVFMISDVSRDYIDKNQYVQLDYSLDD